MPHQGRYVGAARGGPDGEIEAHLHEAQELVKARPPIYAVLADPEIAGAEVVARLRCRVDQRLVQVQDEEMPRQQRLLRAV
jgi:hypothetical protein